MTSGFEKGGKYDITELHKTAQEYYAQKFDTPINDVYILQHLGSGTLCVYCGKYLVDSFTPYKRRSVVIPKGFDKSKAFVTLEESRKRRSHRRSAKFKQKLSDSGELLSSELRKNEL